MSDLFFSRNVPEAGTDSDGIWGHTHAKNNNNNNNGDNNGNRQEQECMKCPGQNLEWVFFKKFFIVWLGGDLKVYIYKKNPSRAP